MQLVDSLVSRLYLYLQRVGAHSAVNYQSNNTATLTIVKQAHRQDAVFLTPPRGVQSMTLFRCRPFVTWSPSP